MPIRIMAVALAAAFALLVAPAAGQIPSPPTGLPDDLDDLLPDLDTARFKVTVSGSQTSALDFVFNLDPAAPCGLQATGTLSEHWKFARGKDVAIIFHKVGPGAVLLQRAGRTPGDTALAAPGTVTRHATGVAHALFPDGSCPGVPLDTDACRVAFPVRTAFNLGWAKGKLTLMQSSMENGTANPALGCGDTSVGNFDELPVRFPFLSRQRDTLTMKDIFNSRRSFALDLQPRTLESGDPPPGYTTFNETLDGFTHVTLTR